MPSQPTLYPMTNAELLAALDQLQLILIAVSTGGPRIETENARYVTLLREVGDELRGRNIPNPIPFRTLWDWYARWSKDDLPSYRSRRTFVGDMIGPLTDTIRTGVDNTFEPTGWARIDRGVLGARDRLATANSEEDFQTVGLLCREALISLGQEVWRAERHPSLDGVAPSDTDAKRRLEAYIAVELASGVNEQARKHARAALDLAVSLQHRRTASFRDAAMCYEGTASIVRLIAIVEGRRDPPQ